MSRVGKVTFKKLNFNKVTKYLFIYVVSNIIQASIYQSKHMNKITLIWLFDLNNKSVLL